MAVGGMQRQAIDIPELVDFFKRLSRKCGLTFKRMQHNPFQQITETHVLQ
ncbi:MAG: hypothetical protein QOJ42_2956, partial [Acidobacteriaceae bacterium]|nr:hypothetical protein [Acidobacteriaceae bacterium]